jgi:hypothetical protein
MASLAVFGVLAAAVTITAIAESYSNLVAFSLAHQIPDWHGRIAPVAVDSFIVLGELLLFAGILLHWRGKGLYAYAVFLAVGGFAMSVGGNVFRATPLPVWADHAVQAIWPVTATAALTGCLIILKRLMNDPGREPGPSPEPASSSQARAPQPPPPDPEARREPRPVRAEARAPGPVAASGRLSAGQAAVEQEIIAELLAAGGKLPSERELAGDPRLNGSRRAAARILGQLKAMSNGKHDGDLVRS